MTGTAKAPAIPVKMSELNFKLMILQHYFSPKASLILEIIRIPMSLDASTD